MKNIMLCILLMIIISSSGCCKKTEPCHSCPLQDGTSCPQGMINVFNNCQCPEGTFWFMGGCLSQNSFGTYWGELNCNCLGKVVIVPENGNIGITVAVNEVIKSFATAMDGNAQSFEFSLIFTEYSCAQFPNPNYPRFVGGVVNDTLTMNVYWHEFGSNVDIPIDSCVNIKLAPVWKP